MSLSEADAAQFLANPAEYFGYSLTRMMSLSRAQLDELQLAGVRSRFDQLRESIPMLERLAEHRGVTRIDCIDDVVPILFDHAVYKSYPASLLDKHQYRQLTAWLAKLTIHDLSQLDVSACRGIDDWLITLNDQTPMAVCHTSGTSGTMSFLPWSKSEWLNMYTQFPVLFFQTFGAHSLPEMPPLNVPCIYPYFRSGGMSHTLANDAIVQVIAGSEDRFHAAYPQRLNADMLLLAARRKAAAARGQLDSLQVDPALKARREEFEVMQREMPAQIDGFFTTMRTELAGQRVFLQATSNLLFSMAESGLKQGVRSIFAPSSVVVTGGGGKGLTLPKDWRETVKEFLGVTAIHDNYGMSELAGMFTACEQGHYHGVPWVVPFILDAETGAVLSREGRVTGRFAFFDLLPDSRWGGFITGDEVTIDWDRPCDCGRTTPYLVGKIERLSAKTQDGSDDKISCADTASSYDEALDFLNEVSI